MTGVRHATAGAPPPVGGRFGLKAAAGDADRVVTGSHRRAGAVAFGLTVLVRRAIMDRTGRGPEGAHGAPDPSERHGLDAHGLEGAAVVPSPVTADGEALHRSHGVRRAHESRGRPMDRHLEHPNFDGAPPRRVVGARSARARRPSPPNRPRGVH